MRLYPIQSYIGNNKLGKWKKLIFHKRKQCDLYIVNEEKAIVSDKTIAHTVFISF